MADAIIKLTKQTIRVTLRGAQGPRGLASGPLGVGSVDADTVTDDAGQQAAIADKIGVPRSGKAFEAVYDATNPEAFGQAVNSVADGKQSDGYFATSSTINGGSGYPFHGIQYVDASIGPDAAGGGGFATDGPGHGSGGVGNRQGVGPGNGLQGDRRGSGEGAGLEGRASSTGTCWGVRALKQDPVDGVAGPGAAAFLINSSTSGPAVFSRSAAINTDPYTSIVQRLNGTFGTGQYVSIPDGGARTGPLAGAATHVVPGTASTGAAPVIGHDFQVNANITGSADVRSINIANNATGCGEVFGGIAVVDGVNTTAYGMFLIAANSATNHALYCAGSGLASFGGDLRALNDGTQNIGTGGARFATIFAATGTINTSDAREKAWLGNLTEAHLRAARRIGQQMGLYQWLDQVAEKGEDGARIHFGAKAQDVVEIFYEEGLETRPSEGDRPSFRHAFLCYDEWEDGFEPEMERQVVTVTEEDWIDTGEFLTVPARTFVQKRKGKRGRRITIPEERTPILKRVEVERQVERYVKVGDRLTRPAGDRFGLRLEQLALFLAASQEMRLAALEAAAVEA